METLPDETPIYKYMAIDSFLHFFVRRSLIFRKISKWPDYFEGKRFDFFKARRMCETETSLDDYFGSCWTLQQEDERLCKSEQQYQASCNEIRDLGSAAMWEAYCKGGGLRVKTTIGKVVNTIQACKGLSNGSLSHRRVYYEPSLYFTKKPETIEDALYHKRTCFRHEDEYRFIVMSQAQSGLLHFPVEDMRDFIDEILVSPSKADESWKLRAIYDFVVGSKVSQRKEDTNIKDGVNFCRISQLYGQISGEV